MRLYSNGMGLVVFDPKLDNVISGKVWILVDTGVNIIDSVEEVLKNAVHIEKVEGSSEDKNGSVMGTKEHHLGLFLFILELVFDSLLHVEE